MMGLISPVKSSDKTITIKHWQRTWIDTHPSINLSGLIQELLIEIIKVHDPKYFSRYRQFIEMSPMRKKEIIDRIVKTTPIIHNT